ncbi:uncharacterized protein LOC124160166 [Ischnura elegans]|uniref:uncharacterized protein LOC124160166 n=1 Tax=Ischnura elegans TaxID=197161 RepID=UPI001ED8A31A|nr:uncharacterized protein LOC124160166 [Ischnura elegans]
MFKEGFLLVLLACHSYAQFLSRPGQFPGNPQPPRQGSFFPRPQQPGLLRQLANLLGFNGGGVSPAPDSFPPSGPDGIRGPAGPRPIVPNQQFFRPDGPPPLGPIQGLQNPQQTNFGSGFNPQGSFQRPVQGPRQPQPQFLSGQQQQQGRIPLGSPQILTFQAEDVRPAPGFNSISPGNQQSPGFLQQQSTLQGTSIRPAEPLLRQPIATQITNDLVGVSQSNLVQQATFTQFSQPSLQQGNPIELVSAPTLNQTATLRDILREDCEDYEEQGYCDSSRRYPRLQVADLVRRCAGIVNALYVPIPESNDIVSTHLRKEKKEGNSLRNIERANQAVWSWAKYAAGKSSVCKSDIRRVNPSYARDISKKWVVVLQHPEGNMVQHVSMDKCTNVDKECLSGPEGNRHPGTRCTQRHTHHHLVTWDPDKPSDCPSLRAFSFPTACLCHFSLSSSRI